MRDYLSDTRATRSCTNSAASSSATPSAAAFNFPTNHCFPRCSKACGQQLSASRWRCRGWNRFTVWGDEPAGIKPASEAPVRLAVLFSGNGFHSKEWWAKGEGKADGTRQGARAAHRFPREDALHPRPLQRGGAEGETSTARRPATCSPARRWRPAARFVPARASTSCSRSVTAARPRCRASCSAARSRTRPSTRTTRCSTARTSRGVRRPRRRRWRFIPRSRSTGCSRTRWQRGDKSVLDAVLADAKDLRRHISAERPAQARRISRLRARRGAAHRERRQERASCRAGVRRSPSRTSRAPPTASRRTSPSTCG